MCAIYIHVNYMVCITFVGRSTRYNFLGSSGIYFGNIHLVSADASLTRNNALSPYNHIMTIKIKLNIQNIVSI